jgi:N-acetylglutamate synthase-like GNAT family acetyltransferase
MSELEPLTRFFQSMDDLGEGLERTWWGAVVTDKRFPLLHDANYAAIDCSDPSLTLTDIEAVLLPALAEADAPDEHIITMDPGRTGHLLNEAGRHGGRLRFDVVMQHRGPVLRKLPCAVTEASADDEQLWRDVRLSFREFDVTEPNVTDQMLRRERDILVPFGKHWFTVSLEGSTAGFGALFVQDDVAYIDNVVTFPRARRRGVATSIVSRMVDVARERGAEHVYLLANEPDPIRLYHRLGFADVGKIGDVVRSLSGGKPGQPV